ncbi:hypothetical protein L0F81_22160 [Streptomyces tricolor]|uniref:DUF389 domain-containing protein n=1 Tax=Streptomyces tricolor TaxID=68277 RepID=A0ABS9JK79_9ACTN|nr:hypothetical protein [Streptomyces tricolor]MCG0065966.1 hypothetical protein [Streptomyces tricolor]
MKATESFTAERVTALVAVLAGALAALLATYTGTGIGNTIGAAFLTYVATIVTVAAKVPLQLGKVLAASGRGTVITAFVTAIVLISIFRALRGLV